MTNEKDYSMPAINKKLKTLLTTTKYFLFVINVIFLVLLSTSFLVWNISPAKTAYLAYLGLAFGIILLLNFLFLLFWLCTRNWIFLIFNIIIIGICYSPIISFFPMHMFSSQVDEKDGLKVLSYNVRGFNWKINKPWDTNPIVVYLQDQKADIICIQEYVASTDPKKATSEKLSKALDMPYYKITPLRAVGSFVYGLAIFSKYPIKTAEKLPLETTDNGSVLYNVDFKGKILTIINNHLESNRLTSKDKKLYADLFKERTKESLDEVKHNLDERLGKAYAKRAPQSIVLSNYIKKQTTDGTIVCGDFNDTPISYTYHTVKEANLVDSYIENGFGPGITYHENHFLFRIDFIFHTRNMMASNFKIGKVRYSDHYPISTYIKFK